MIFLTNLPCEPKHVYDYLFLFCGFFFFSGLEFL
uniref:Uncharacterized protein MANES_15G117900 n=1 Tax=Rhizophora mucronata TaxID=61149 RepID=A0A2P2JNJ4_RHIMU